MVRVRKDKADSSKPHSKAHTKQGSTSKKDKDRVLQQQISALGGMADDYDLVKNVGSVSVTGSAPADPKLAKDVSSFLQDLKTGGKTSTKVKSVERQKKEEKQTQKSKKKKTVAPEKKAPSTEKHAPPQAEVSEAIQLPKKITFNSKSAFIIQPAPQWYSLDLPTIPAASSIASSADIGSQTSHAASLHSRDIETFKSSSSSHTSEASFLSKIIQSGTLSDRLSALTLLVQSGPIHNVKALETLKSMAERGKGKGGRDESLKALRCIVDWWVGGGAPNRKLKYFRDRPVRHPSVTDQHLLLWYFEDWLKKYFFSVLQVLEMLSLDPLPYVRTQSLNLISTLLRDKPEQEQNLLRLLVNKLGDTDKAICSRASHHILQLLQTHPSMKSVIVTEITSFVLRPTASPPTPSSTTPAEVANRRIRFNEAEKPKPKLSAEKKVGNPHARYYATITFNQIVLTPDDREVALRLIDLYFEIFKELLGEGDRDGGADHDDAEEKEATKDKSGRLIDGKRGKGKLKGKGKGKGKMTEIRGAAGFTEVEDANSKLISAILTGVNRALPFAKIDVSDARLSKHIDTLFLITHTSTFNISLQALVLIQQIAASLSTVKASSSSSSSSLSKSIIDRFYRTLYDSLHDARLASSSKQAMYLNLLFKAIKADVGKVEGERVKALVRRFVQVLVSGGNGATEFVAGGLFLLGELFSTTPGLKEMIYDPPKTNAEAYDPRKRDPQYAHASSSPLWELTPLVHHYHPTISLHARQILSSQPLTASADLSLNTLSHFLDRFVYKNPKKSTSTKGASAMQPAASGLDGTGVKLMKGDASGNVLVNDAAFMKMKIQDVPVDEVFFHKFFARKNERNQSKVEKDGSEDEDEDEDGDDGSGEEMDLTGDEAAAGGEQIAEDNDESDDEEEVWKAMKASMPKAEGDDDLMEDSDIDEDDLPSDFDADEDDDEEPDDSDDLSLAEGSDNDDLISLDGDMPEGLIEYDGPDEEEEEEWGGIDSGNGKRKRTQESKEKRKKFKSLPTFASYEDYAKMIEDGPEDDI